MNFPFAIFNIEGQEASNDKHTKLALAKTNDINSALKSIKLRPLNDSG